MKPVCFPLTTQGNLCGRKKIIDELKNLVKDVECDDKSPICRDKKKEQDKKSEDEKCYCGNAPGYHQHVMMDGQLAKSVKSEDTFSLSGTRWCPPCVHIKPLMDPIHSCYRAQGKEGGGVAPRNGMPPEDAPRSAGDSNRSLPQQDRSEVPIDDVFGGQSCPYEHPAPTRGHYYCPTSDPMHVHWSPPQTRQCRYPNTCVASCFQHPAVSDWIYRQPKYRCYLQNTNDKPFKIGF